jgi:hypothetical protein
MVSPGDTGAHRPSPVVVLKLANKAQQLPKVGYASILCLQVRRAPCMSPVGAWCHEATAQRGAVAGHRHMLASNCWCAQGILHTTRMGPWCAGAAGGGGQGGCNALHTLNPCRGCVCVSAALLHQRHRDHPVSLVCNFFQSHCSHFGTPSAAAEVPHRVKHHPPASESLVKGAVNIPGQHSFIQHVNYPSILPQRAVLLQPNAIVVACWQVATYPRSARHHCRQ